MRDLVEQVEQAIRKRGLLREKQTLLVAVSGGLDSMVLLDVLHQLSNRHWWKITVGHLNHGLRGRGSDADERLVLKAAKELGMPAVSERADVRAVAKAHKLSLEMAARKTRHEFLARIAESLNIKSVALAHHADDQLELFLIRLLRGSGSEGLAGMKWQNVSPYNNRIQLVRPLLAQSKATLRTYAQQAQVPFREDASNACLDIQRNRIRHELLPLLERNYQSSFRSSLFRTMEIIGAEAELVTKLARTWLDNEHRQEFKRLPLAVQRRCIQWQLIKHGLVPSYELVEQLRENENTPVCAAKASSDDCETQKAPVGVSVHRQPTGILHLQTNSSTEFDRSSLELALKSPEGQTQFAGLTLTWHIVSKTGAIPRRPTTGHEWFDADLVGAEVLLRHWRPGDRFQPIGMEKAVKVQDLLVNQKIPRKRRHQLVIAATSTGEAFWVEGLRISERFKLAKTTNRRLHWMWRRL
jgi:tRNA(Ile)-lysidine synthase